MPGTFEGKVVLVTGGTRGLGVATAKAFASQGANIALSYVASSEEKAESVVAELTRFGVRAVAIKSDQGNPAQAASLISTVLSTLGKLDILVNNAAVAWQGKRIDDPEIDNAAMDRQWVINTFGVIANIRAAAKVLPEGGRIISVGSGIGGRALIPGTTDYSASKAAVVGYTRGAARDLGPRNITVNVVQAGMMDTDMAAASRGAFPKGSMTTLQGLHAIARLATVEETAAVILFLAGPNAGYITGSVIDVNGGVLA